MFTRVASDREGPDSITGDLLYFVLEQVVHQKKEVKKEERAQNQSRCAEMLRLLGLMAGKRA